MFESRLLAISAAASLNVNAQRRHDDFVDLIRRNNHAEVAGERFVAGRAAERDAEKNFVAELDGFHADVVRVLDRADQTAAVVGDV